MLVSIIIQMSGGGGVGVESCVLFCIFAYIKCDICFFTFLIFIYLFFYFNFIFIIFI